MITTAKITAAPLALVATAALFFAVVPPAYAAPSAECATEAASLRQAAAKLDARAAGRVLTRVSVAEAMCQQHNGREGMRKLAEARAMLPADGQLAEAGGKAK